MEYGVLILVTRHIRSRHVPPATERRSSKVARKELLVGPTAKDSLFGMTSAKSTTRSFAEGTCDAVREAPSSRPLAGEVAREWCGALLKQSVDH